MAYKYLRSDSTFTPRSIPTYGFGLRIA